MKYIYGTENVSVYFFGTEEETACINDFKSAVIATVMLVTTGTMQTVYLPLEFYIKGSISYQKNIVAQMPCVIDLALCADTQMTRRYFMRWIDNAPLLVPSNEYKSVALIADQRTELNIVLAKTLIATHTFLAPNNRRFFASRKIPRIARIRIGFYIPIRAPLL